MSISISLLHKTEYLYDQRVSLSHHVFCLKPTAHTPAVIESYNLAIEPSNHTAHWQQDLYGNSLLRIDFSGPTNKLLIKVHLKARLERFNPFGFLIDNYALSFPFAYPLPIQNDLLPYLAITERGPALSMFAKEARAFSGDIVSFLVKLNNMIFNRIAYVQRMEEGIKTCEETLLSGTGACRDSGWLLIQVLRHLGLASRYVSGYLIQFVDDHISGTADLHAWAEVYIPELVG